MKVIGLTGGVGAGKSTVLNMLQSLYSIRLLIADDIARKLQSPGYDCYNRIREAFPDESLYLSDGSMDRNAFARLIFSDESKRALLDDIVHPSVDAFIKNAIEEERASNKLDAIIMESAILLDVGLKSYCDEIWYVYAPEEVRAKRLSENRGYSKDKIKNIMKSQKSEADFKRLCDRMIVNDGDENALREALKGIL